MAKRIRITEGNRYIHQFPLGIYDGMTDTNYKASMQFIPIKVSGQTISKFTGQDLGIVNTFKKGGEGILNLAGDLVTSVTDRIVGNNPNEDAAAEVISNHRKNEIKSIRPMTFDDDFGVEQKQRACLYMPMTVQQMENVSVGPESLGVIGGSISSVIAGGNATLTGLATKAAQAGLGGVVDFVSGNATQELGSLMANKIASRLNTQAGLGVQNATRIQISPNTRAMFKQVNIREWSFTFQLIPTSEEESILIENIIDFFRMEQLPVELGAGGVSMAYRFPNLMTIDASYTTEEGEVIPIITRFLPSYLQAVDVTYNTTAMSFYENGKYHDATMSLKFIEYRPLNKHDIIHERDYLNKTTPLAPNDIMRNV
jgi:hypothetical protein